VRSVGACSGFVAPAPHTARRPDAVERSSRGIEMTAEFDVQSSTRGISDPDQFSLVYCPTFLVCPIIMKLTNMRSLLVVWLSMACLFGTSSLARAEEPSLGIFDTMKETYEDLPPPGKFAAGAVLGFTGTRFVVNKAVGIAKIAGAAFIASEALNAAGVLEKIPKENMQTVQMVKQSAVNVLEDFRLTVRRRLKPEGIRNSFEAMLNKERMTTLGFASGAFVSCVL
jgi:hypothetical protein